MKAAPVYAVHLDTSDWGLVRRFIH